MGESVAEAIARNPEIRAAAKRIEASRAMETAAAAWPNPNLSLSVDQLPLSNLAAGGFLAGVSQPLLFGGQLQSRIEAARLDRQIAEYDREILARDLARDVREAYVTLLYQLAGSRYATANDEAAKTLLKATQARYKAGEVAQLDVLRAEVAQSRTQRELSAAEGQVIEARGHLNVLLGRSAQSALDIGTLPQPARAVLPETDTLIAEALKARVELRRAEAVVEREAIERRIAQAGLWTGTQFGVEAGTSGGAPVVSSSITVPIPFYRQQGEIAAAEAERAQAEARREALRNAITLEIVQARRDAILSAERSALFRKSYLPQAERLLENAQRRFEVGEGSGLDVIEARGALRETQAEYQQAVLQYREALARLDRAVGKPLNTP